MVAVLNSSRQRVLLGGLLKPAQDGRSGGDPLAANFAARELALLEEVIDGVYGYGEEFGGHADVEDFRNPGGQCVGSVFEWLFPRHRYLHVRDYSAPGGYCLALLGVNGVCAWGE